MNLVGISRRKFLARGGALLGGTLSAPVLSAVFGDERLFAASADLGQMISTAPEARFWLSPADADTGCTSCHSEGDLQGTVSHQHPRGMVQCRLCARNCVIGDGERGRCRARINVDGTLRSLVYGRPIAMHIDPIEKKPFYHFLPGRDAFSLATAGCPLSCKFCQNWQLSQAKPEDYQREFIPPEKIAGAASSRSVPVVAFTYNEPTVFTEYLLDIAAASHRRGCRNVIISCGFMNPEPLSAMLEVLDAVKIDLKGFSGDFYLDVCDADLQPVLNNIKRVAASGTHLELVNLVVPTLNDSETMMRELCKWVAGEAGTDVPVHFTRFHPDYKMMNLPPTPVSTLERAREIALEEGLHYPYVGNVPGHPGNNTYCPSCGGELIQRAGYFIRQMNLDDGNCSFCKHPVAGVWS